MPDTTPLRCGRSVLTQGLMFSGLILACTTTVCQVFAGPIVSTEEECLATVSEGAIYIQTEYPQMRLVDYKCVQWSEGA
jgi:hypothetical protein